VAKKVDNNVARGSRLWIESVTVGVKDPAPNPVMPAGPESSPAVRRGRDYFLGFSKRSGEFCTYEKRGSLQEGKDGQNGAFVLKGLNEHRWRTVFGPVWHKRDNTRVRAIAQILGAKVAKITRNGQQILRAHQIDGRFLALCHALTERFLFAPFEPNRA
jgi:hypothetical protein